MAEFIHSTTGKRICTIVACLYNSSKADDDGVSRCIKLEDAAMFLKVKVKC